MQTNQLKNDMMQSRLKVLDQPKNVLQTERARNISIDTWNQVL